MKITVLTRVPESEGLTDLILKFLEHPRHAFRKISERKKLGGHHAVTRSIISGLNALGVEYNYDPINSTNIAEVAIVLSGTEALKKCIELKKQGKIKTLFAGPNMVVHADDNNCIMGSKEIDRLLIPSEWVKIAYERECAKTKGKIYIWPSGVDEDNWKPLLNKEKSNKILLYKKIDSKDLPKGFYNNIYEVIKKKGYDTIELQYGEYTSREFMNALNECRAMVYVSKTESQGLALLESWAMNVPTLVWESGVKMISGRKYKITSTAPYLTEETGMFWKSTDDLGRQLNIIEDTKIKPRRWVEKNMTDAITCKKLLVEIENVRYQQNV